LKPDPVRKGRRIVKNRKEKIKIIIADAFIDTKAKKPGSFNDSWGQGP
jgi:hypothetical protein